MICICINSEGDERSLSGIMTTQPCSSPALSFYLRIKMNSIRSAGPVSI